MLVNFCSLSLGQADDLESSLKYYKKLSLSLKHDIDILKQQVCNSSKFIVRKCWCLKACCATLMQSRSLFVREGRVKFKHGGLLQKITNFYRGRELLLNIKQASVMKHCFKNWVLLIQEWLLHENKAILLVFCNFHAIHGTVHCLHDFFLLQATKTR